MLIMSPTWPQSNYESINIPSVYSIITKEDWKLLNSRVVSMMPLMRPLLLSVFRELVRTVDNNNFEDQNGSGNEDHMRHLVEFDLQQINKWTCRISNLSDWSSSTRRLHVKIVKVNAHQLTNVPGKRHCQAAF